jgi:hypothetical protein
MAALNNNNYEEDFEDEEENGQKFDGEDTEVSLINCIL